MKSSRAGQASARVSGVPTRGATSVANAPHSIAEPPAPKVAAYNFRRPSRFSKDHLRTLQMIHEQFARSLASSLSTYLRLNVRLQLDSVEQAAFDEFVERLPSSTILYVLRLDPLGGAVLLELSVPPTRVMLDRLCGGPGVVANREQHLTEIERSLLRPLGRHVLRAAEEAWAAITQMTATLEDVLLNPRAARAVVPNDVVALVTFELAVGDVAGRVSLCLPYLSLDPIVDQLSARVWSLESQRPDGGENEEKLRSQLLDVPLPAVVELGQVELPASTLLALREGDVIRLGTPVHGDLTMVVGEHPFFRCRPGLSAGHLAARIERLGEPISNVGEARVRGMSER